ncbi:MAG: hypothetical protein ACSLFR_10350, partial [Solirubrobacteraceae bacterium]
YFDTAWWQVSDVLAAFVHVPPGQLLYASDMPYGPGVFAGFAMERAGRAVGLRDDVLEEIAGRQLGRIVAGEEPIDLGPAPGPAPLGARSVAHERVVAYLTAAVSGTWSDADPEQSLALARLAIADGGDPLLALVDTLIERTQEARSADRADQRAGLMYALTAQFLAGTPTAGLPG